MHVMFQLVISETKRLLTFLIVTAAFYVILIVVSINAYISKRGRSGVPERRKLPAPIHRSALKTLAVTMVAAPGGRPVQGSELRTISAMSSGPENRRELPTHE